MKKIFAVLMLATMLFAVGCGNQAQEAAKDAQQKVEQKADEVKKDAEAKVDEAKDKAAEIKDDAAKKADEMKADANAKVDELKEGAEKLEEVTAAGQTIALSGVMPGASLDDLKAMFGEPTLTEGDVLTFVDGLKVKLDNATKKVKEISTTDSAFTTPEGMYVGAEEYLLNEYCGPADAVRQIGGAAAVSGGAEYEYYSGDKKSKVVYTAKNGIITEITCAVK